MEEKVPIARYVVRETLGVVVTAVALLWSAGSVDWWQGWVAIAIVLSWTVSCQDWLPNLAKFSFTNPASYDARKCLIRLHPAPFIRTRLHVSDEGSSRYRSAESITFSFLTVALTIER